MEFLRFGSSIPGSYWGCCAVCIIQNFKMDPDGKSSIQLVSGDGGGPLTDYKRNNEMLFAGPTYRDIFKQRIRIGTFSSEDMPNHGFLAVLTDDQIATSYGKKWLAILKEEGFEFIRTVDNSVYTGSSISGSCSPHPNYIFGLFRNISGSRIKDPLTPPKAWADLPSVIPEAWEGIPKAKRKAIADGQTKAHKDAWKANGPTKLMVMSEIEAAGAPVVMAGQRSEFPQEPKVNRDQKIAAKKPKPAVAATGAFAKTA